MATAIDTLKIYERLRKANLGDEAAKEIAEVIKETSDFTSNIKPEIKEELSKELATKADLKAEVTKLELKIESIKVDIEKSKSETLKWMFLFWAGQLAAMFTLFKFFLK